MAEFLIVYKPKAPHPNAEKDKFRYKKGDVVAIHEDGGTGVPHPESIFIVIKVSGISKASVIKYAQERFEGPLDGDGFASASERRKFNIDFSLLSAAVIKKLDKDKVVSVPASQVKKYIKDAKTGVYEA